MSKGGGGGSAKSSSSNPAPWAGAAPYLTNLMAEAAQQRARNTGGGYVPSGDASDPWRWVEGGPGRPSGYAAPSWETNEALNAITDQSRRNIAHGNPLVRGAESAAEGLLAPQPGAGEGYAGAVAAGNRQIGSPRARGLFEQVAGGAGANPFTNRIVASGAAPTPTGDITAAANAATPTGGVTDAARARTTAGTGALGALAAGGTNPHLDAAFGAGARQVGDAVKAQFFGQGAGSGYQQDLLQRGLSDLATSIYLPAYESDANRRLSAAGTLAGVEQGDLSRRLSGETAAAGLRAGDIDRRLSGAATTAGLSQADRAARTGALTTGAGLSQQDLANRVQAGGLLEGAAQGDVATRLGATGLLANTAAQRAGTQLGALDRLPTVQGAQTQDAQNLLSVGGMRDADTQSWLNELQARYNEPFRQLGQYANIVQGFGGIGTQSSSSGREADDLFGRVLNLFS